MMETRRKEGLGGVGLVPDRGGMGGQIQGTQEAGSGGGMAQRKRVGGVYGGEDSEPVAPADGGEGDDGGPGDINQVGRQRGRAFTSPE